MIIDSFTFYNELDLLEFRLRLLYDYVDKFVIVEGDKTFSGKDKPLYFQQNRNRFQWAADKLVVHQAVMSAEGLALGARPAEYDPQSGYFNLEYQQRNAIREACQPFADDCILLISDVDEIPSREVIALLRSVEHKPFELFAFDQKLFYYKLDCQLSIPWRGTIATHVGEMRKYSPQNIRNTRTLLPHAPGGGWHLSYFGSPGFIANKIDSFAHQEFNDERFKNEAHLSRCIEEGADLFGRDLKFVKPPRDSFPEYFRALAEGNPAFFFATEKADQA